MQIVSTNPTMPIGTSVIRRINLAGIIAEQREHLAATGVRFNRPKQATTESMRPTTADRLTRAARIYTEAWSAGSNSPTQDVADAFGVTYGAAGNLIYRARQAGLLATPRK